MREVAWPAPTLTRRLRRTPGRGATSCATASRSVALLCTVASPASLGRRPLVTSAAMRAQARSPFEPFRRDLPRIPELLPVRSTRTSDIYAVDDPRGDSRHPAGLPDADLRLRGRLPGPDDPRAHRSRGRRSAAQRARIRLERPPARRVRARRARRASDGRDRGRGQLRVPLPEPPGRGDALVPRPRARPHVADAVLRAARRSYILEDDLERELELPTGDYDVPIMIADHAFNKDGSFRYVGERRRRLPR